MSMMDIFAFEESPWELFAKKLKKNDTLSGARLLTLLEGENEETVEDAFQLLEDLRVTLDISDLPGAVPSGETGVRLELESKLVKEGTLMTGLSKGDPLGLYLEELAELPVCGDVELLALELTESEKPEQIQSRLVNLSLSRVVELACGHTGRGVLLMDLIQEGSMGLWQSILNHEAGQPFEENRDWWIRQYMAKCVALQARENGVGGKLRKALEQYRAADRRLLAELGRNPTLEEIALELNMTPEETFTIREMLRSAQSVQKTQSSQEPEQETEDDARHVEDTAYFQMRQRITEMLSVLSEQEAKVLTLRFGLEGGLPLDPAQTGAKLGLTAEEVMKMEATALGKLRADQ